MAAIYKAQKADYIDWKRFTTLVSTKLVKETIDPLTSDSRRSAFVVDDSIFDRNRSQKVELLTRQYDHANHRYVKGFRMLTLGWSDGVTFLPVNSCLLSTENTEKRLCRAKEKVSGSTAAAARKLAQTKATEVVPILVKEVQNAICSLPSVFVKTKISAQQGQGFNITKRQDNLVFR